MKISPTAQISTGAIIEDEVIIDDFVVIQEGVKIGRGTKVHPHAVIMTGTTIGSDAEIFPGAILGSDPQDLKYEGEQTSLRIGDGVRIREFCTINRGTKASGETVIGDHSLIMAYTHVAHDCHIEHHAVVSNSVNLAGHVWIGSHAIIGGMSAVQQFVKIGRNSFIGGASLVRKDVPPYIKVAREPLAFAGVNVIGLKRKNFTQDVIDRITEIYRILFVQNKNISRALDIISTEMDDSAEKEEIINFVRSSENGIIKGYNHSIGDGN